MLKIAREILDLWDGDEDDLDSSGLGWYLSAALEDDISKGLRIAINHMFNLMERLKEEIDNGNLH